MATMANKADKWAQNALGRFYVDQQCIDCDLCRETAPNFFTRNDEGGHSFVHKQPETEEDIALCMEALEGCPVEAIGDDGGGLAGKIRDPQRMRGVHGVGQTGFEGGAVLLGAAPIEPAGGRRGLSPG